MKILLVDDHTLFRDGIAHVLQKLADEMSILEAGNGLEALSMASEHPDLELVLLDLNLPDHSGFDILSQFSQQYPTLPVIIISASEKQSDMRRAIEQGALGYIGKGSSSQVMLNAIHLVMAGEIYMPASLIQRVSQQQKESTEYQLTQRQRGVLKLMDQGYANKLIADKLNIAESTVKMHITAIFRALQVTNRTQAVLKAQEIGLVERV